MAEIKEKEIDKNEDVKPVEVKEEKVEETETKPNSDDDLKAFCENKIAEFDKKIKELEKRIIDAQKTKKEPAPSNNDDGAIGY